MSIRDEEIHGGELHVIPTHGLLLRGRKHAADKKCWCEPREDEKQPGLWIHTFQANA